MVEDCEHLRRGGQLFVSLFSLPVSLAGIRGGDLTEWMLDTYRCNAYPSGKKEATVSKPANEGEHARGKVGIDGVYGEEADNGRLGSIVDQPREGSMELSMMHTVYNSARAGFPWLSYQRDIRQSVKKNDR